MSIAQAPSTPSTSSNSAVSAILISPPSLIVSLTSGTSKILGQYNFVPSASKAFPIASVVTQCQTLRSTSAKRLLDYGAGFIALQKQQTVISIYTYETCFRAAVYNATNMITDIAYISPNIYYSSTNDNTVYKITPPQVLTTTQQAMTSTIFSQIIPDPVIMIRQVGHNFIVMSNLGNLYICSPTADCTNANLNFDPTETIIVEGYLIYTSKGVYGISLQTNSFVQISTVPQNSGVPLTAGDNFAIYSNGSYAIQMTIPNWNIVQTWQTTQSTSSYVVAAVTGNLLVLGESQGNTISFRAIGMQTLTPTVCADTPSANNQQSVLGAFGLSVLLPLLLLLVLSYMWFMLSTYKNKRDIRRLKEAQPLGRRTSRQSSIAKDGKLRRNNDLTSTNTLWDAGYSNKVTDSRESLKKKVSLPDMLPPLPAVKSTKMLSREEIPQFPISKKTVRQDSALDEDNRF